MTDRDDRRPPGSLNVAGAAGQAAPVVSATALAGDGHAVRQDAAWRMILRAFTENRLALAEVLRGLDQLSPEHRVLIGLVCVDGMTYKQAAEILEVPLGTVMSRLARARLALHDAIHRTLVPRDTRRGRPFR